MFAMFYSNGKLANLDVSKWDVSQVTNFSSMFDGDIALTTLAVDNWDTHSATDMSYMFWGDTALTTLNVAGWQTGNVTNFSYLFYNNASLTTLDLGNWQTSQVTSMAGMFNGMTSLTSLNLANWDTSQVTDMSYLFANLPGLTSLDVSNWDTSHVTNMNSMFWGDTGLTSLAVGNWNTSQVTDMSYMFSSMTALTSLDVSKWNTSQVTTMTSMFWGDAGLTTLDVSNWQTSNVVSFSYTFSGLTNITNLDVSKWDTHSAQDFSFMFNQDTGLTALDVSKWDTSAATNMHGLFYNTSALTELDVSNWDTSLVTDMGYMFYTNTGLTTLDVSNFETGQVTTMRSMFYGVSQLATLNVGGWDTANVTDMGYMFYKMGAVQFLSVGGWNTSAVTNMHGMFYGDTALLALDLSNFDMRNVTDAGNLLYQNNNLRTLKLGENTALVIGTANAGLPNIKTTDPAYTGQWIGLKSGQTYTSATLMSNYTGALADTYVWQAVDGASTIVANDSDNLIAGPKTTWQASDNFVSATDSSGKALSLSDMTVMGRVDPTKAGTYNVLYSYVDSTGSTISKLVTVVVAATKGSLAAHDTALMAGPNTTWAAEDSFAGATDENGDTIPFKDITVTGADAVDPSQVGSYQVTYSYTDGVGNEFKATITVTVQASQATINADDTHVTVGQAWHAEDSFAGATDSDGNMVDFKDVTVTGADTVDTSQAGSYQVTYSYTDAAGNTVHKTITVTVSDSKVSVNANDTNLIAGPDTTWTAEDSFAGATDADGNTVDFKDVTVTGADAVDPTKAGHYQVSYSYTDQFGNQVTKTITVTVAASQAAIEANDTTITVGKDSTWNPADSFVSATDADGKTVDFDQLTVIGADTVDLTKVGDYQVTYQYTDAAGNQVAKTITVKVVASQAGLDVSDSTITVGETWQASDNFTGGTDADGQAITFADVTVTGDVDTTKAGSYQVTYHYTDKAGNDLSKTITVTVVDEDTDVDPGDNGGTDTGNGGGDNGGTDTGNGGDTDTGDGSDVNTGDNSQTGDGNNTTDAGNTTDDNDADLNSSTGDSANDVDADAISHQNSQSKTSTGKQSATHSGLTPQSVTTQTTRSADTVTPTDTTTAKSTPVRLQAATTNDATKQQQSGHLPQTDEHQSNWSIWLGAFLLSLGGLGAWILKRRPNN